MSEMYEKKKIKAMYKEIKVNNSYISYVLMYKIPHGMVIFFLVFMWELFIDCQYMILYTYMYMYIKKIIKYNMYTD